MLFYPCNMRAKELSKNFSNTAEAVNQQATPAWITCWRRAKRNFT